ncbi:hypothetical protein LCGC14_1094730 [marine sediment metagenome]|uniref:Uncharacterized protein n=1 Tax=marine sediment metagenome TaxID=412755 RepID=A0A0F9MBA2_9ZZZZ
MQESTSKARIEYEAVLSRNAIADDEWRVEGIDYDSDGQIYVAIFCGPQARARAEEYARFKNAQQDDNNGKRRLSQTRGSEHTT